MGTGEQEDKVCKVRVVTSSNTAQRKEPTQDRLDLLDKMAMALNEQADTTQ